MAMSAKAVAEPAGRAAVEITRSGPLVSVVGTPDGYGLLPITLSIADTGTWTGLGKTKINQLIRSNALITSKIDGRTLVHTSSAIDLIERNRIERGR